MIARIKPYVRPLLVLSGAGMFLACFLNGYLSAGGGGHVWPIVLAVAGMAVLAAFLIALSMYAQVASRRVSRLVEEAAERAAAERNEAGIR